MNLCENPLIHEKSGKQFTQKLYHSHREEIASGNEPALATPPTLAPELAPDASAGEAGGVMTSNKKAQSHRPGTRVDNDGRRQFIDRNIRYRDP